ncbi:protein IcmG (DotF) [Legionella rubrilucens]|uniref:Protein IcmG (DotF) n=1 Tax=Legionella rubrilucens TaxID=458 RepID=A0A0W0XRT1_9GAMM|nr:type IVB secretion system protein IcmG/DotF [Legionella rubrilucens]KTD47088.1 protein IcmG (DotF) [Legionella rubrilucens]
MVDNNQNNDEYQFADLDVVNPDGGDDDLEAMRAEGEQRAPKKDVRKNALIVIALIVVAMIIYKFMGAMFSRKPEPVTPTQTVTTPVTPTPVTPVVTQPTPSSLTPVPTQPQPTAAVSDEINQKLSALELAQQGMRSEITTINNQLNGLSGNVNDLSNKIAALSQSVSLLAAKVEQQSQQIAVLTVRTKPKPVPHVVRKVTPRPVYYIQAVIPGRAWLIATNGSTLTVREGSVIAGYGTVKLIDATQGRVVMSTGQIIRFSQQDS